MDSRKQLRYIVWSRERRSKQLYFFLHARDKLKTSATKHNKDVMHVRFMSKALSDDELLLINDCIYFIYNYSHDVLFYALLDLRVSCCKCKLSTGHMSCTAFIRSLCDDVYIKLVQFTC